MSEPTNTTDREKLALAQGFLLGVARRIECVQDHGTMMPDQKRALIEDCRAMAKGLQVVEVPTTDAKL